jgi:hypothetical protein
MLKNTLERFAQVFRQGQQEQLVEADTVMHVTRFFSDVLGYDVFSELTQELMVHGRFCDLAVRLEGAVKFVVEVKPASFSLADRQIGPAESASERFRVPWVVLTNGVNWRLYHLTFAGSAVEHRLLFDVDVSPEADFAAVWRRLGLLSRAQVLAGSLETLLDRGSDTEKRPATTESAGSSNAMTVEQRLLVLKRLHDQELIDGEEYREKKRQLLDEL